MCDVLDATGKGELYMATRVMEAMLDGNQSEMDRLGEDVDSTYEGLLRLCALLLTNWPGENAMDVLDDIRRSMLANVT